MATGAGGHGRVAHAARSSAALAIAATAAYQRGLARLYLPDGPLAGFVAILCTASTLGGSVALAWETVLGCALAVAVDTPWLLVPARFRVQLAFAAPVVTLQSFVLGAADLPAGVRMFGLAVAVSLMLEPVSVGEPPRGVRALQAVAALCIGAGAAIAAHLLPPLALARAVRAAHAASGDALAARAFGALARAFTDADSRSGVEAALVTPRVLLAQLDALPRAVEPLHADAEWEWDWPRRRSSTSAAGPRRSPGPADVASARHLRRMLDALRAHADAVASAGPDSAQSRVHATFQAELRAPLQRLSKLVASLAHGGAPSPPPSPSRGGGGGCSADAVDAEMRAIMPQLHAGWHRARVRLFYPPGTWLAGPDDGGPPAEGGESAGGDVVVGGGGGGGGIAAARVDAAARPAGSWEAEVAANLNAYADGGYGAMVNSFLISAILYCLGAVAPPSEPGGGGGPERAAARHVRAVLSSLAQRARWDGWRGAQYALAICLASVPMFIPAARRTFPHALLAPVEASLQLMGTAGASARRAGERVLGTVTGAGVGLCLTLATRALAPALPSAALPAVTLGGLCAWTFLACLLRGSRTHGAAALVAAWTAPFVAAAVESGSSAQEDALGRCAMTVLAAGSVAAASLCVRPRWALAEAAEAAAQAAEEAGALLAAEVSIWRAYLRRPTAIPSAQAERAVAEAAARAAAPQLGEPRSPAGADAAGATAGAEHAGREAAVEASDSASLLPLLPPRDGDELNDDDVPLLTVDEAATLALARTGARLRTARALWAGAEAAAAAARADEALCGVGGGAESTAAEGLAAVSARGAALCLRLEHLFDSAGSVAGPSRSALGGVVHAWPWAETNARVGAVGEAAQALGAALGAALRLTGPRAPGTAPAAAEHAHAHVASAAAALRTARAALAASYAAAIHNSIRMSWGKPGLRSSVGDALLHNSTCEALLLAAAELLALAREVEAACAGVVALVAPLDPEGGGAAAVRSGRGLLARLATARARLRGTVASSADEGMPRGPGPAGAAGAACSLRKVRVHDAQPGALGADEQRGQPQSGAQPSHAGAGALGPPPGTSPPGSALPLPATSEAPTPASATTAPPQQVQLVHRV